MAIRTYSLLFFTVLFLNQATASTTIQDLPKEVILKILEYAHNDYFKKLFIANTLNKDNFFADSLQQVLACQGIKTPRFLFSCKQFYQHCLTNQKELISKQCESCINYLIQYQSTFNLGKKEKRAAINNLALLFFNFYLRKFRNFRKIENFKTKMNAGMQLSDAFIFALTFESYSRHDFLAKDFPDYTTPYIQKHRRFFKNTQWFDATFENFPITSEKKLIIMHCLSALNIKLNEGNKYMLEKFLETPDLQDKFIALLKRKEWNDKSRRHITYGYENITSADNRIKIINFLLQYSSILTIYSDYGRHYLEVSNQFKNLLIINDFIDAYYHDEACFDCTKNKKILVRKLYKKKNSHNDSLHNDNFWDYTFWGDLLQAVIHNQNNCAEPSFNNDKTVKFIKKYHPHFENKGLIKILSLFQQYQNIRSKYSFYYTGLLNKNSNTFENLLNFAKHHEKEHSKEKCNRIAQNKESASQLLEQSHSQDQIFHRDVMKNLQCSCWQCNKIRFFPLLEVFQIMLIALLLLSPLVIGTTIYLKLFPD